MHEACLLISASCPRGAVPLPAPHTSQRGHGDGWGLLNKVIRELNGKDIEDVTAQGVGQLTSRPAGRAVADSAAPGTAAPAAGSALPPSAAAEKSGIR